MSRLSAADSSILSSFYFHGTPIANMAASLGISSRAVEGRLRRARGKLRAELAVRRTGAPEGTQFPALEPVGFSSGTAVFAKKSFTLALLPFAFILAFAPLAFKLHRLPRKRLAWLRIVGGASGFLVVTLSLPVAARETYAQGMRFIAAGLVAWGVWMLLTPWRERHNPKTS